jgi:hypothetical protein
MACMLSAFWNQSRRRDAINCDANNGGKVRLDRLRATHGVTTCHATRLTFVDRVLHSSSLLQVPVRHRVWPSSGHCSSMRYVFDSRLSCHLSAISFVVFVLIVAVRRDFQRGDNLLNRRQFTVLGRVTVYGCKFNRQKSTAAWVIADGGQFCLYVKGSFACVWFYTELTGNPRVDSVIRWTYATMWPTCHVYWKGDEEINTEENFTLVSCIKATRLMYWTSQLKFFKCVCCSAVKLVRSMFHSVQSIIFHRFIRCMLHFVLISCASLDVFQPLFLLQTLVLSADWHYTCIINTFKVRHMCMTGYNYASWMYYF